MSALRNQDSVTAITNRARLAQLVDFKSLRWGKVMPTDLDAVIEIRDKGYVILEAKVGKQPMPFGQRLAIERMANDLSISGKWVLAVVVSHDTPLDEDVDLGACWVEAIWSLSEWVTPPVAVTARDLIDEYLKLKGVKL